MEPNKEGFKIRLGIFIIAGLVLFIAAIFIIGKQKNLFDPVFKLSTKFKNVSGLQVGSAIRFSGINIGTVDNIEIINDSTVSVTMLIKKSVQKFIHSDSQAGIGSEGIIGDKLIVISQGSSKAKLLNDGQSISSTEPIETDAIMSSLKTTADNAAIATSEINLILGKINRGDGTLGRLIQDKSMANNIDKTLINLKNSSKGLNENMEAAKHNFLLRGYFKKKEKAEAKKKEELNKKK
ncbi:MlaD family protein [Flavobacterium sp. SUN052]|uniref:MlaD family protein n=1 Tax=Flavobacterium sp. SUN052 TaxID=3002441 RepID=UPI00237EACFB|nr:MlaD family protein [Flavobacterium sp. SUN052]MEC4005602.1 MlaD family protein [Flavobacterium sp. SUN052]